MDVPEWVIEPVQSSLHDVTKYGTAASNFIGFPYDIAGKTGTAENSQGRDSPLPTTALNISRKKIIRNLLRNESI